MDRQQLDILHLQETKTVHLLCLMNWSQGWENCPDRLVNPLWTVVDSITNSALLLERLILLGSGLPSESTFVALVDKGLESRDICTRVSSDKKAGGFSPEEIATRVSVAAQEALEAEAVLWVDLTSGPKDQAAVLFAAASAVPDVRIVYSERHEGEFIVKSVERIGTYNSWLGRHGVQIRNYCEELRALGARAESFGQGHNCLEVSMAIRDALSTPRSNIHFKPRLALLTLAEWAANVLVPTELLKIDSPKSWQSQKKGETSDGDIRARATSESQRALARASQVAYQLRCLMAHPREDVKRSDVTMLMDCLSFLSRRMTDDGQSRDFCTAEVGEPVEFIAVDGDDVGRTFETRVAQCNTLDTARALQQWSEQIQMDLSLSLTQILSHWGGGLVAKTGDGFVAVFEKRYTEDIRKSFRPTLSAQSATTGIGPSIREAYLALKLGKATNRGGGFYLSLDPPREGILWTPEPNANCEAVPKVNA